MPSDLNRFDDLFTLFGKIQVRRMFGGEGLYRDNVMFGIVFDERIYLKTNDEGRQAFIAERSVPFTYPMKKGDATSRNYYALPDRLYDDPEELAEWARTAFAVASARNRKRTPVEGRRKPKGMKPKGKPKSGMKGGTRQVTRPKSEGRASRRKP